MNKEAFLLVLNHLVSESVAEMADTVRESDHEAVKGAETKITKYQVKGIVNEMVSTFFQREEDDTKGSREEPPVMTGDPGCDPSSSSLVNLWYRVKWELS